MNRNEAILFIGKCLSLNVYPDRAYEIIELAKSNNIDWVQIVSIASQHLILPALYFKLKKNGICEYLSNDLVFHLKEISELNQKRNENILNELKQISALLNEEGISIVLLKGCAHLTYELYDDISVRMIGDIDFLVHEKDIYSVAEILIKNGYYSERNYTKEQMDTMKHYPRLLHKNKVAAVEIHRQVLRDKWNNELNSERIWANKIKLEGCDNVFVPSKEDQILHSILNTQLNDRAYFDYHFHLRQLYDLFLLSKDENTLEIIRDFRSYFKILNANMALCHRIFEGEGKIFFEETRSINSFINRVFLFQKYPSFYKMYRVTKYYSYRFSQYPVIFFKMIIHKKYRKAKLQQLAELNWYIRHIKSYKNIN